MKNWTDDFLSKCLADIPQCEYRRRAQSELEDHLACLAQDLEDAGHSPQDARASALEYMGDPFVLNQNYQQQFIRWQQKDPFYTLGRFFYLALLTGCYYLAAAFFLGCIGFTPDASFADRVSYPLYGNPLHQFIYGSIIFTIPFSLNALHLRRAFRLHPHTGRMVTAGLLFTWFCEKSGLFFLSSLLGGDSMLHILTGGWSDAAPWLNLPYIIFSFLGCFILGAVFAPRRVPGGETR